MDVAWSKTDQEFLRKLRIEAGDPWEPLPRFHVEAFPDGSYRVIDKERPARDFAFHMLDWPDPKAAAEECARQWNSEQ